MKSVVKAAAAQGYEADFWDYAGQRIRLRPALTRI